MQVFVQHGFVLLYNGILGHEIVTNYILDKMNFNIRAAYTIELELNVHLDVTLPHNRCEVHPPSWSNHDPSRSLKLKQRACDMVVFEAMVLLK